VVQYAARNSDHWLIESVMVGELGEGGRVQRPAEPRWHLVIVDGPGSDRVLLAGPKSTSGSFVHPGDLAGIWVQMRLGVYLPGMRMGDLVDAEVTLSERGRRTFDLLGTRVEIPTDENVEAMVQRLVRDDVLAFDPLVAKVLAGNATRTPERTLRHRMRLVTGQPRQRIGQVERAKHGAALIAAGMPLAAAAASAGYTDQPHMTRSMKRWLGVTPGQARAHR